MGTPGAQPVSIFYVSEIALTWGEGEKLINTTSYYI
jgi:hypothetical protein